MFSFFVSPFLLTNGSINNCYYITDHAGICINRSLCVFIKPNTIAIQSYCISKSNVTVAKYIHLEIVNVVNAVNVVNGDGLRYLMSIVIIIVFFIGTHFCLYFKYEDDYIILIIFFIQKHTNNK